jgi:DME family drug/metabolite transporter
VRAVLAVLLAAVCFGTTGTAQALGPAAVDPLVLGAARIAVGGLALAAVAAVVARRAALADRTTTRGTGAAPTSPHAQPAPTPPAPTPPAPTPLATTQSPPAWRSRATLTAVALGALGVVAYQPAFFAGTARNGVAVGTVVALGSAPVVTGLLAWALRRQRPAPSWLAATALATAGVAVLGLAPGGTGPTGGVDALGVLASLGAGAAYALYTLAGAALIDAGRSSTTSMGAMFGVAGAVGVVVLAVAGTSGLVTPLVTPAGVATVLWLGLVTTTLAYVLFGYGLARLGAPAVATLTLAEPLTATVLGLTVLGERLPAVGVLGLGVLAAGLVVLAAGARSRRPAAVPA